MQVLSIWEWTESSNKPLCQAVLGEDFSYQTHLTFHGQDSHQLVSNSDDLVVFYNWVRAAWRIRSKGGGWAKLIFMGNRQGFESSTVDLKK